MFMQWTWQRARQYLLCLAILSATARAQSPSSGGVIPVKLTLAEAVRLGRIPSGSLLRCRCSRPSEISS
jgi:hypothetical protein